MDKWKGKVAAVTGSSRGIGAHLAKTLAQSGMIVIGLCRRVDAIQELAREVEANSSGKIIARKCDVTDEADVLSTFDWIKVMKYVLRPILYGKLLFKK